MRTLAELEVVGLTFFDDEMKDKDTGEIRKIDSGKLLHLVSLDGRFNKVGRSGKFGRTVVEQKLQNSALAKQLSEDPRLLAREVVRVRVEMERVSNGKGGHDDVVVAGEIVPAQAAKVAKVA